MKITYEKMTTDEESRILHEIANRQGVNALLQCPAIYEIVREDLNNEILDQWAKENPEQAQDWTEEENKINKLDREDVVWLLENCAGCQCYEDESLATLRTALLENVKDGTVPAANLDTRGA